MSLVRKKIRIGDLLVQHNVITQQQLENALKEQKRTGRKLGKTLMDLEYLTEDQMLIFLSQQLAIPFVDLDHYQLDQTLVNRLPEVHARRYRAIILSYTNGEYLIGMGDPTDLHAVDQLQGILKANLNMPNLAVVRETQLLKRIDMLYRRTQEIEDLAGQLDNELDSSAFDLGRLTNQVEQMDAPVAKLLSNIFEDAVTVNASDIHIEPDETVLRIRQRVDGVLLENVFKETRIVPALVLRLKLMAGLNISEKRLPQDGRFNMKVKGRSIDVRLSTMPVQHGESVVMRLLDQSSGKLSFDQLQMPDEILTTLKTVLARPHGLILVTGPTGSGKTTTLYSSLNYLNLPERKIITVEDPVEYRLPRINQVQINSKIGLSFASVLRTTLRQDPDIIMVGEMRDQETAEIGLRAAMTGHLVLSTLHTNDAVSSTLRLMDMGAAPFLVSSALRLVMAQRLVRKVCEYCKESYTPTEKEYGWIRMLHKKSDLSLEEYVKGCGCPQCNNTGYRGRVGVYELLVINEEMVVALRTENTVKFAELAYQDPDFKTLGARALEYAEQGITSLEEVFKVAAELEF